MLNILKKTTASMANSSRSEQYDAVCDDDLSVWEFVNGSISDDEEDLFSFDEDDVISGEPELKADDEEEEENGDADTCDSRDLGLLDDVMSIQSLSVSPPVIISVDMTRHRAYHDDDDEEEEVDEADTCDSRDLGLVDDVMSIQSLSVSPPVLISVEVTRQHAYHDDDEVEEAVDEADTCDSRDLGLADDVMSIQSLSVSPPVLISVELTRHQAYHNDDDDVHDYDDDEEDVDDDVDDELMPWILKGKFGKQRIRKMGKRGGPNFNKSKRLPYYYNRPGCLYGKHGLGVQHSFI